MIFIASLSVGVWVKDKEVKEWQQRFWDSAVRELKSQETQIAKNIQMLELLQEGKTNLISKSLEAEVAISIREGVYEEIPELIEVRRENHKNAMKYNEKYCKDDCFDIRKIIEQ